MKRRNQTKLITTIKHGLLANGPNKLEPQSIKPCFTVFDNFMHSFAITF